MRIEIRSIDGVEESEKEALDAMQKAFSRDWLGYASFEMLQRQGGNQQIDLVLVLPDRILVVELKKWHGTISSDGEQWFQNDEPRERSPVKKTQLKAKMLASLIRKQLGEQLTPFIDSRVVLCGSVKTLQLQPDERPFVMMIGDFLRIADPKYYTKEFPEKYSARRPLEQAGRYRTFFMGESFRPKVFAYQNFVQEGEPLFRHPKAVYSEYRAVNKDDPQAVALMRRWDFAKLGLAAATQKDRALVATREQRVLTYIANRSDEAAQMLLVPISSTPKDQISTNHCELFRLPRRHSRLNQFVNKFSGRLTAEEKVDVLRAILHRFSVLHKLNVAHRDIGPHSLWVDRPANVLLSGFVAGYFPETETVGGLRDHVRAGEALLPDDAMNDEKATPFSRDVFLLAAAAHSLLFGVEPKSDHGMYLWTPRTGSEDPFNGTLNEWFEKALAWTASERFSDAAAMLEAFNSLDLGLVRAQVVDLSWFSPYKNSLRVDRDYPPDRHFVETDAVELYQSVREHGTYAIKIWWNVREDEKRPAETMRLLRFLQTAQAIQQSPLQCLPKIIHFGLSAKGAAFIVREWTPGMTLQEWIESSPPLTDRRRLATNLAKCVARLHDQKISHGDLSPTNIICNAVTLDVVLIDLPDLRLHDASPVSTAYAPTNWEQVSIEQRDRFAVAVLSRTLLDDDSSTSGEIFDEIRRIIEGDGALSLDPLVEALSKGAPAPIAAPFEVGIRGLSPEWASNPSLLSDNGKYYVTVNEDRKFPDQVAVLITGVRARLRLHIKKVTWELSRAFVDRVSHQQFLEAAQKCTFHYSADIQMAGSPADDASDLLQDIQSMVAPFLSSDSKSSPPPQKAASTFGVQQIWSTLIDAEADALLSATVSADPYSVPGRDDIVYVPYRLDSATLDFEDDDAVDVIEGEKSETTGDWLRVGVLSQRETTASVLAIQPRWGNWSPSIGSMLRLRSRANHRSYDKRKRAVERILQRRSVISDLIDQFDPAVECPPSVHDREPSDAELDAYDLKGEDGELAFSLNADQRFAFKRLISNGPVGLLQGPPGTGKTAFIASFVHYLIAHRGVQRVLLVSQSHEAVNNALEKTLELSKQTSMHVDAVRIGQQAMLSDGVALSHPAAIQQQYRERFVAQFVERHALGIRQR